MRICRLLIFVSATLIMASCGQWPAPTPPPEIVKKFNQAHRTIVSRNTQDFLSLFDHKASKRKKVEESAAQMWAHLPKGKYIDRILGGTGWKIIHSADGGTFTRYTRIYQYQFEDGFALITIIVEQDRGKTYVRTLRFNPLKGDLRKYHAFKLKEKPLSSYVFLGIMVAVSLLSLGAAISVISNWKRLRRPKLWLIVATFGIYMFTLNWTTGEITPQALYTATENETRYSLPYMGLFSIGILHSGPLSPWVFNLHIPLGALLFWLQSMRGRLAMKPVPPKPEEEEEAKLAGEGNAETAQKNGERAG